MFINGEQADGIRAKAVDFVTGVLDFRRGDLTFQDVCKGYTGGKGAGTSCSFLPHWMLWKIGVSKDNPTLGTNGNKRNLINRTELSRGTSMVHGDGVSTIWKSKAFVTFKPNSGAYPLPGDVVLIVSEPYVQAHEHVFVFLNKLSDDLWKTGESGQAREDAAAGVIEGKLKERPMRISAAKMTAKGTPEDGKPDRKVVGWLDISKLDYQSEFVP